ncbi:hypothetical protein Hanom_Chr11g00978141 [Helianthus anomalus]
MSLWSGSWAWTHVRLAVRRRIDGLGWHWTGTTPSHVLYCTPPRPDMLLCPARMIMVLALDVEALVKVRWSTRHRRASIIVVKMVSFGISLSVLCKVVSLGSHISRNIPSI